MKMRAAGAIRARIFKTDNRRIFIIFVFSFFKSSSKDEVLTIRANIYEYIAAYYGEGDSNLENGSSFTANKTSTKYSTMYYSTNEKEAYKYGDATCEIDFWHQDDNDDNGVFLYTDRSFFNRGGNATWNYGGIFASLAYDRCGILYWNIPTMLSSIKLNINKKI